MLEGGIYPGVGIQGEVCLGEYAGGSTEGFGWHWRRLVAVELGRGRVLCLRRAADRGGNSVLQLVDVPRPAGATFQPRREETHKFALSRGVLYGEPEHSWLVLGCAPAQGT